MFYLLINNKMLRKGLEKNVPEITKSIVDEKQEVKEFIHKKANALKQEVLSKKKLKNVKDNVDSKEDLNDMKDFLHEEYDRIIKWIKKFEKRWKIYKEDTKKLIKIYDQLFSIIASNPKKYVEEGAFWYIINERESSKLVETLSKEDQELLYKYGE